MALNPQVNHKNVKDQMQKERRIFLRKAAYSAPVIITMGQLLKPTAVHAESALEGPPEGNDELATWTGQ